MQYSFLTNRFPNRKQDLNEILPKRSKKKKKKKKKHKNKQNIFFNLVFSNKAEPHFLPSNLSTELKESI